MSVASPVLVMVVVWFAVAIVRTAVTLTFETLMTGPFTFNVTGYDCGVFVAS